MNIKTLVILLAFLLSSGATFASTQTGLAWESPLQMVVNSITGPVAYVFAIVGVVVSGFALVLGGDIQGFVRGLLLLTLVISMILLAAKFLAVAFGVSGATLI